LLIAVADSPAGPTAPVPALDEGRGGNRMGRPPFDLANPPEEPPAGVLQPMLWRVAVRLRHDHNFRPADRDGARWCRACGDPWPCRHRRLAERALLAAWRESPGGPTAEGEMNPGPDPGDR
jgi:hypothetical protein